MDLCSICEKNNWQFMFAIGSFSNFVGANQGMRPQGWLPFFDSAYQAVVDGEEKSNNLERGMIPSETYFLFEASNASGINIAFHFPRNMPIVNQHEAASSNIIWHEEFNRQSLGIGDLSAEFADIFQRAFSSRVFPAHMTNKQSPLRRN
ncbi:hypothetical protein C5167_008125 [Papaver somniferum]|uniref:Vesicle-fusing ATPase n=1 Tax=Papaver somniferum TaxID=3469 RepID=A0A4Y7JWJ1_PAPSO|nr:hypothetical protein C5167_008125 [Papaver somniferum]